MLSIDSLLNFYESRNDVKKKILLKNIEEFIRQKQNQTQ